jgi:hypothetical protein
MERPRLGRRYPLLSDQPALALKYAQRRVSRHQSRRSELGLLLTADGLGTVEVTRRTGKSRC